MLQFFAFFCYRIVTRYSQTYSRVLGAVTAPALTRNQTDRARKSANRNNFSECTNCARVTLNMKWCAKSRIKCRITKPFKGTAAQNAQFAHPSETDFAHRLRTHLAAYPCGCAPFASTDVSEYGWKWGKSIRGGGTLAYWANVVGIADAADFHKA